jgi:hypothetical protein
MHYEHRLLFYCYYSGQMSEKQWQDHLRDSGFSKWISQHFGKSCER